MAGRVGVMKGPEAFDLKWCCRSARGTPTEPALVLASRARRRPTAARRGELSLPAPDACLLHPPRP